jgi:hypothetical protein
VPVWCPGAAALPALGRVDAAILVEVAAREVLGSLDHELGLADDPSLSVSSSRK